MPWGVPYTDEERAARHAQLYGGEPPAQRQGLGAKAGSLLNLLPQPPISGPPLPRGAMITWQSIISEIATYRQNIQSEFKPGEIPQLLPDVIYLTMNSIARAALNATISPGVLVPWVEAIDRYVASNGKFSHFDVSYSLISPPPFYWDYKCKKCLRFVQPNGCKWVEGVISPQAWCAVWVPAEGYEKFTWPKELIEGSW